MPLPLLKVFNDIAAAFFNDIRSNVAQKFKNAAKIDYI